MFVKRRQKRWNLSSHTLFIVTCQRELVQRILESREKFLSSVCALEPILCSAVAGRSAVCPILFSAPHAYLEVESIFTAPGSVLLRSWSVSLRSILTEEKCGCLQSSMVRLLHFYSTNSSLEMEPQNSNRNRVLKQLPPPGCRQRWLTHELHLSGRRLLAHGHSWSQGAGFRLHSRTGASSEGLVLSLCCAEGRPCILRGRL